MKTAVFTYNIKLEGVEPVLPNGRYDVCVSKMNENFGGEGERAIYMTCLLIGAVRRQRRGLSTGAMQSQMLEDEGTLPLSMCQGARE